MVPVGLSEAIVQRVARVTVDDGPQRAIIAVITVSGSGEIYTGESVLFLMMYVMYVMYVTRHTSYVKLVTVIQ